MQSRKTSEGQAIERVALKDERLVYRACSAAFAHSLGCASPAEVIGKTDFDLFPGPFAREQMALDSRTMFTANADLSAVDLTLLGNSDLEQAMIVRTPVMSDDNQVRGIDLRLLSGPAFSAPRSAVSIDYQTLVNDGIQGSLIIARHSILFANDNAAKVLGYPSAQSLIDTVRVADVFSAAEYAKAVKCAVTDLSGVAGSSRDRVTLLASSSRQTPVRLIARVTHVQWGASRALLLSFVDVALLDEESVSSAASSFAAAAEAPEAPEWRRLRSNQQRYLQYASAAADFFWEIDSRLTFRVVSDGLVDVLGIPRERILGRTLTQLLDHPANINDTNHWKNHVQQLRDGQPFRDFEYRWSTGGETRVIRYSGLPVFNRAKQFVGYRGVGCDVTASVRQAETTAYHASHDALTGLYNRRSFDNTLRKALDSSKRSREPHALCFMDLDSFKIVNDTAGHQAGDELLRQLSRLFDTLVRSSDVLARLGGDEFGVLLYKCSAAEAMKLANQIRHEVENFEFLWDDSRFTIGVSIGLVVVDDRWSDIDSLFSAVDSACYLAKNEGRNRVVVYREAEGNISNRKVATHWVEEINNALENNRLYLACQEIMPLHQQSDGYHCEIFLRLQLSNGDLVSPQVFLPTAERYGLTSALDERAISLTLKWLQSDSAKQRDIRFVSLNLSAGSCTEPEFAERIIRAIGNSGIVPETLCFEISETAAVANLTKVSAFMELLSGIGCQFSIDDFGSGLSSFAFLRKLPVDFVKIDGHLVKDILQDQTDYTMVKAICEISASMGKRTVAEHIESPGLLEAVREIGVDFGQGEHIGGPELIS